MGLQYWSPSKPAGQIRKGKFQIPRLCTQRPQSLQIKSSHNGNGSRLSMVMKEKEAGVAPQLPPILSQNQHSKVHQEQGKIKHPFTSLRKGFTSVSIHNLGKDGTYRNRSESILNMQLKGISKSRLRAGLFLFGLEKFRYFG